jgi:hypothetical protein
MKAHKHTLGHEHEFEPQYGLPEQLPPDERVLWQGSPNAWSLAVHAFHLRKIAAWFALWMALRLAFDLQDGVAAGAIVKGQLGLLALAALGLGLVAYMARLSATQAVYTLTTKRVVMRIGIVLTVTFNLPFRQVESAGLRRHKDGTGDIPLVLAQGQRIAWLQLWPHARPLMLRRPQPMLRSLPLPEHVAQMLTQAWQAHRDGVSLQVPSAVPSAGPSAAPSGTDATHAGAGGQGAHGAPEAEAGSAPPQVRPVLLSGRGA